MEDISGVGLKILIQAHLTFPTGFEINEFADDTDPLDSPELQIADSAVALNGDLVTWDTPNSIEINIAPIPGSDAHKNLERLLDSNRTAKNKLALKDIITMLITYPDGEKKTLTPGKLMAGNAVKSVSSSGRYKTPVYRFRFENKLS